MCIRDRGCSSPTPALPGSGCGSKRCVAMRRDGRSEAIVTDKTAGQAPRAPHGLPLSRPCLLYTSRADGEALEAAEHIGETQADDADIALLGAVGRQRVDSGQVRDEHALVARQGRLLLLDRDAGPVAHIAVGTGDQVEMCIRDRLLPSRSNSDWCKNIAEDEPLAMGLGMKLAWIPACLLYTSVLLHLAVLEHAGFQLVHMLTLGIYIALEGLHRHRIDTLLLVFIDEVKAATSPK